MPPLVLPYWEFPCSHFPSTVLLYILLDISCVESVLLQFIWRHNLLLLVTPLTNGWILHRTLRWRKLTAICSITVMSPSQFSQKDKKILSTKFQEIDIGSFQGFPDMISFGSFDGCEHRMRHWIYLYWFLFYSRHPPPPNCCPLNHVKHKMPETRSNHQISHRRHYSQHKSFWKLNNKESS